jgi:hypothetical protein
MRAVIKMCVCKRISWVVWGIVLSFGFFNLPSVAHGAISTVYTAGFLKDSCDAYFRARANANKPSSEHDKANITFCTGYILGWVNGNTSGAHNVMMFASGLDDASVEEAEEYGNWHVKSVERMSDCMSLIAKKNGKPEDGSVDVFARSIIEYINDKPTERNKLAADVLHKIVVSHIIKDCKSH